MPLIGLIGGIILGFGIACWATVKLVVIAIQSENPSVVALVDKVWLAFGLGTSAFVLVELWDGLAVWATGLWHYLGGLGI